MVKETINKWLVEQGLIKNNYKGNLIPAVGGIFFILGSIFYWMFLIKTITVNKIMIFKYMYLTLVIGSAGLIDDVLGKKNYQGFSGHFSRLISGKITTGLFKAVTSLIAVYLVIDKSQNYLIQLIEIIIVLLMTNFINLLDLRPGRAVKFFILISLILIVSQNYLYIYFMPLYLITIVYLPYELKGKIMLGDTGSNTLGVILGYSFIIDRTFSEKLVVLFLLIILTALSEKYSFSKVIAENKILNWFDYLGRRS
ncbi:MAG: UDP-N-acetylmuramyl pentapeptide phosphotransferase [Halanaerobiales bacterium]